MALIDEVDGNPASTSGRRKVMKRTLPLLIALVVALAACGGGAATGGPDTTDIPDTTTSTPPTTAGPDTTMPPDAGPDDVVLRVTLEGGFVPIEFAYNTLARYTLLADGRLLFEGPVPAIFPGPLLPAVQVAELAEGDIARILDLVAAADLPGIRDETNTEYADTVADAPNTVVTYFDENGAHRFSVYALGFGLEELEDPRVPALQRLVDTLDTMAFGDAPITDWEASSLQVIATEAGEAPNDPAATVVPWPLDAPINDLGTEVMSGLRCIVVEGDDLAAAGPVFENANQLTFFDDGTTTYRLTVRPLLPGDTACPSR